MARGRKIIIDPQGEILPETIEQLEDLCGNRDIALFYLTWLKNGMNAQKAYHELHPNVTLNSAGAMGSTWLAKVPQRLLYAAHGLDEQTYFEKLKEGLDATKLHNTDDDYIKVPDYAVRRQYHKALGEGLGIESPRPVTPGATININATVNDWLNGTEQVQEGEVVK